MKKKGYDNSEGDRPFSPKGGQEQALRLMEALSGVEEELLERSDGQVSRTGSDGRRLGKGDRKKHRPLWQYRSTWAAVLCFAVMGAMGLGGYGLMLKVNQNIAGGIADGMADNQENDAAIRMYGSQEDSVSENGILPGDGAEILPEAVEEQKITDLTGQQNAAEGHENEAGAGDMGDRETEAGSGFQEGQSMSGGQKHDTEKSTGEAISDETGYEDEKERESDKPNAGFTESAAAEEACPAARLKKVTEEEARENKELGAWIPRTVPQGYVFEEAFSDVDREEENLTITWTRELDSISWTVVKEEELPGTVDVNRPETYDVHLYEIPWAETVPEEYRESMDQPVFASGDFDLEIVRSRMIQQEASGDTDTPRGNFAVIYPDNRVIYFQGRGTAEEVWEMFMSLEKGN